MRIVLLSMNYAPELTGIGKYSGEMAQGLIERGHEVTVVCAPPYYPAWSVQSPYRAWHYRTERPHPKLTVLRCPVWVPKRLRGSTRLLHLASFAITSLPILLALVCWRPKVVFTVAPALFCAPAAWLAARLAGAKAWLHVQDFEIDAAFGLGMLRSGRMHRLASFLERTLLRRFDTVSTISSRMLRQLATKGKPLHETELLPNWVDVQSVRPLGAPSPMRAELGIAASSVVCLCSGTINRKQGLDVVVETARLLGGDRRIVFVICGNGEMRGALQASARGLQNVRFLDLRPAEELNALLNMADIHLLPQLRGAADLVMPSKLVGMLASGRPIIAAARPGTEIASIVSGCGIVTEPEDAAGFAQAIAALSDDPARRQRLGSEGRAYAESVLDARRILDRLHLRLEALPQARSVVPARAAQAQRRPRVAAAPVLDIAAGGGALGARDAST
ncbi:MAG TPA: glycosyltransferase WbuB [Caldimonas sp.]|nr:glycosyltransferase WbuB [Caldimonas sp.]